MQASALVSTDIGQLHSQLPELNLKEWAAATTEQAVRAHVAAAFKAVENRITAAVHLLYSKMADAGGSMGRSNKHYLVITNVCVLKHHAALPAVPC
jgi:hypothetical protein